jgi:hypothetical protein
MRYFCIMVLLLVLLAMFPISAVANPLSGSLQNLHAEAHPATSFQSSPAPLNAGATQPAVHTISVHSAGTTFGRLGTVHTTSTHTARQLLQKKVETNSNVEKNTDRQQEPAENVERSAVVHVGQ